MSQELIYTSSPQGLRAGSFGFCTVATTPGMSPSLIERLEALSGYRHAYPPAHPKALFNPTVFSHLVLKVTGQRLNVLSRIADAGLDYSQRTNKLAHHVALTVGELSSAGPAWVLSQPGWADASWSGTPRILPNGRTPPQAELRPLVCRAWEQAAGDAGWAGVLAQQALDGKRPAYVIFPEGMDILALLVEAQSLLPIARRWEVTFSTYFTRLPAGVDCLWRCVLAGSPEASAAASLRGDIVVDLTHPNGMAANGPMVDAARTGTLPFPSMLEDSAPIAPSVEFDEQCCEPMAESGSQLTVAVPGFAPPRQSPPPRRTYQSRVQLSEDRSLPRQRVIGKGAAAIAIGVLLGLTIGVSGALIWRSRSTTETIASGGAMPVAPLAPMKTVDTEFTDHSRARSKTDENASPSTETSRIADEQATARPTSEHSTTSPQVESNVHPAETGESAERKAHVSDPRQDEAKQVISESSEPKSGKDQQSLSGAISEKTNVSLGTRSLEQTEHEWARLRRAIPRALQIASDEKPLPFIELDERIPFKDLKIELVGGQGEGFELLCVPEGKKNDGAEPNDEWFISVTIESVFKKDNLRKVARIALMRDDNGPVYLAFTWLPEGRQHLKFRNVLLSSMLMFSCDGNSTLSIPIGEPVVIEPITFSDVKFTHLIHVHDQNPLEGINPTGVWLEKMELSFNPTLDLNWTPATLNNSTVVFGPQANAHFVVTLDAKAAMLSGTLATAMKHTQITRGFISKRAPNMERLDEIEKLESEKSALQAKIQATDKRLYLAETRLQVIEKTLEDTKSQDVKKRNSDLADAGDRRVLLTIGRYLKITGEEKKSGKLTLNMAVERTVNTPEGPRNVTILHTTRSIAKETN